MIVLVENPKIVTQGATVAIRHQRMTKGLSFNVYKVTHTDSEFTLGCHARSALYQVIDQGNEAAGAVARPFAHEQRPDRSVTGRFFLWLA